MNTRFPNNNNNTRSTRPQYRPPQAGTPYMPLPPLCPLPIPVEFSLSGRQALVLMYFNIITWVEFLHSTILTVTDPRDVYHSREATYMSPAPWAYLIWGAIHFFLIGLLFYQFTPNGKTIIIDKIMFRFMIFTLLSAVYLRVWTAGYYGVAFFLAMLLVICLVDIHWTIRNSAKVGDRNEAMFVRLPISLIEGWISVLFCVTAFEAIGFDPTTEEEDKFTIKALVFLCLFGIHACAVLFAIDSQNNIGGNIAIAWSLSAIYAKQNHPGGDEFVITYSRAFAILSIFWCGFSLFRSRIAKLMPVDISNDPERDPLINN